MHLQAWVSTDALWNLEKVPCQLPFMLKEACAGTLMNNKMHAHLHAPIPTTSRESIWRFAQAHHHQMVADNTILHKIMQSL